MAAMDLRTNQEVMGMRSRYSAEYGGHMFKGKDTFEEADIQGNNNIFNSLKTETTSNHSHDSSSLYEVKCSNKKKLEVDNSLFSYSSFKKAMDLRTHNRTLDGEKRTIFDDAEYFAKNHCYKLLPITFEHVDETIIQSEHNYSLFSLTSESEPEEDCSRMMDYSQIKEKNYKRRRTKFREGSEKEEPPECRSTDGDDNYEAYSSSMLPDQVESAAGESEHLTSSFGPEPENLASVQPLDLSGPLLAEEKTDLPLRERDDDSAGKNDEMARLDSDKENVGLELSGIRVTITRPDEKENYEPCDLFLNDIARLVPWLIDKDCLEVDILDRTCEGHDEFRKHRLYYVISESTWRLFQTSNERVILTNDKSLGQPVLRAEKGERPSFLVFDQFSLAKCLAEYCQEIGGCFEYTCIEEGKDQDISRERDAEEMKKEGIKEVEVAGEVEKEFGETVEVKVPVEAEDEGTEIAERVEWKPKEKGESLQDVGEELQKNVEAIEEERRQTSEEFVNVELPKTTEHPEGQADMLEKVQVSVEKSKEEVPSAKQGAAGIGEKRNRVLERVSRTVASINKGEKGKGEKKKGKETKPKSSPPIQPKPKNSQMSTRSKSTSESETSQKSDERVNTRGGRKREGPTLPKAEPPVKLRKAATPEAPPPPRRTRSGKVLEEAKPAAVKKEAAGGPRRRPAARGAPGGAAGRLRPQRAARGQGGEQGRASKAKGRRR